MTPEQLSVFADCGGANFPIPDACTIAGCTIEDFANSTEAQNAYRTEQLKTELKIRQSVIKMAKEGMPAMVKIYLTEYAGQILPFPDDDQHDDPTENPTDPGSL